MTMKGLLEDNKGMKPTPEEVEERFQGNICRCTGCKYHGEDTEYSSGGQWRWTVAADMRVGGGAGGGGGRWLEYSSM